jgi:hypothetical protein
MTCTIESDKSKYLQKTTTGILCCFFVVGFSKAVQMVSTTQGLIPRATHQTSPTCIHNYHEHTFYKQKHVFPNTKGDKNDHIL